jgi:hypothetical protein
MIQKLAKQMEQQIFETIAGPPQNRRQTALRARGNGFETVELDDDGKVIEPMRCTCGVVFLMHQPRCPFYCLTT